MSEPYMPLRLNIHDDPDIIRIAHICECSVNEAVGAVTRIWAWANRHLSDGVARGVTLDDIDRIVTLRNAGHALIAVGFLRQKCDSSNALYFVKFSKWNAQGLKARSLAAERQRRYRERHRNVTRNARVDDFVVTVNTHTNNSLSPSLSSLLGVQDNRKKKAIECMTATGVSPDSADSIYARAWSLDESVWVLGQREAQRGADSIRDIAAWWAWWAKEGHRVVA